MPNFRPRRPDEEMGSYLKEKQAFDITQTGTSGIQLGTTTPTPKTELPTGMTQLTSPFQIPAFDIKGQIGKAGEPGSYLYGTPKITPEALKPEAPLVLPPEPKADLTAAGALVAGATATIDQIMKQLTPTAQTETEKRQQTILDKMATLTGGLAEKAAEQLTAEQAARLPELRTQFADINAQILTKMAEYNVLMAKEEGKPITMASIIGAQAQIQRVKASEIGLLQAQAQGLQGQIQTAQETVNRSIDLKYSTIEAQINVYQAQLNAIQPTLNKEEKIQAQAQQIMLDTYKQKISDKKTEDQNIQKTMLEAIKSGITDTNVLAQISASSTYSGALEILGENMPEAPLDTQIITAGGRQLLINKVTGETIRDLGAAYKAGVGEKVVDTKYKLLESEAQKEINNILSGQSVWSESWNRLRQYAVRSGISVANEELNILLGGEIPYEAGIWTTEKATGLASAEEVRRRQQAKYKQPLGIPPENIVEETDKYIKYRDVSGNIQIQYK